MGLLVRDMDTIHPLVAVKGFQDHQAARIITHLLHQEDILRLPTHLVLQHHVVQHGLHNSLVTWDPHLPMDLLHLLHRVLMTCTIDLDGPNLIMELRVRLILVRIPKVMAVQDQCHLVVHLPAHLQGVHLQAHILFPRQEGHQFKAKDMEAVGNLLTLINIRYVDF